MANSQKLIDGRMTAEDFLNKIVYKQAEDDFGLLNTEYINPIVDEDEDDEEESECENAAIVENLPKGRCILCTEKEPEMCILPCFDFCVCEACYLILKNNSEQWKCPKCDVIAIEAKKMNFV